MAEQPPPVIPREFPPSWAGGWGEDAHGIFAQLMVQALVLEMRWIPPGSFLMGPPATEVGRFSDEGLQHSVTLSRGFWLAVTPCTQDLWGAVMGENPSQFKGGHRPVENVDWNQAVAFCQGLTERVRKAGSLPEGFEFRLPTEAEWEYACRAGTKSAFNDGSACTQPTGKDPALERLGWYDGNSGRETHPVGEKLPNAWGLYDMHGNVWEWCADRADWKGEGPKVVTDTYVDGAVDPLSGTGARRVARGGSCWSRAWDCRSAFRMALVPGYRFRARGFRLAAGQVSGRGATSQAAGGAAAPGPEAPAA